MSADPRPVVPYVAREVAPAWLDALRAALPEARILPFAETTPEDRAAARVALAADPDPAELAALPALEWVQSLWAGVERIVAELPQSLKVVRLVDPQLAASMAEAVLAWTLYLHRDMPHYAAAQARGEWAPAPMRLAQERPVAILGLGHLGKAAARRLLAQDFPVMGWTRTPSEMEGVETFHGPEGLAAILSKAEIAVSLLPLTPQTRGLLGAEALDRLPKGAGLINFGRGPVVDVAALCERLSDGRLGHAVLDVFEVEPLPAGDPLWTHPGVTILPHISAPTHKGSASAIATANVRRFLETGEIPQVVDRGRGY
ncbi:2-hydroxyacid dehydrogenase [Albimonas pacifica]|uniref:Glyoxylate/hydroxypyruvate reductase A n=1 Tax=Albimonas pacifica TaxID=1114924 RepID=A0A1I3BLG3_9RHOB|nr:glyoxylate/hydroxypyruvate reductase A [Albimonas pacifica]SFH63102.1 glyoxylate/hydroxypyruvate reductase A [Albimonas pacifica]